MKFRVALNHIYEDTGDPRKDRLVMIAKPTGALFPGPGLGDEEEALYEAVPEELHEEAFRYWKED